MNRVKAVKLLSLVQSHLKHLKDDVQCNVIDEVRIKVEEMPIDNNKQQACTKFQTFLATGQQSLSG